MSTVKHLREVVRQYTSVVDITGLPGVRCRLITPNDRAWYCKPEETPFTEPFWAFCWPGSWAIAAHLQANPSLVAGKRVFDFAAGCGNAGITATKLGAKFVLYNEIDPTAGTAIIENCILSNVAQPAYTQGQPLHEVCTNSNAVDICDRIGEDLSQKFDVVLAGDVMYEQPLSESVMSWLHKQACNGLCVLLGDPGRTWMPKHHPHLREVGTFDLPTHIMIENRGYPSAGVWQFTA